MSPRKIPYKIGTSGSYGHDYTENSNGNATLQEIQDIVISFFESLPMTLISKIRAKRYVVRAGAGRYITSTVLTSLEKIYELFTILNYQQEHNNIIVESIEFTFELSNLGGARRVFVPMRSRRSKKITPSSSVRNRRAPRKKLRKSRSNR